MRVTYFPPNDPEAERLMSLLEGEIVIAPLGHSTHCGDWRCRRLIRSGKHAKVLRPRKINGRTPDLMVFCRDGRCDDNFMKGRLAEAEVLGMKIITIT